MKIPKKLTIIALVSALAVTPIAAFGTVFPAGSLLTSWNEDGVSIQAQYPYDAGLQSGTRAAAKDSAGRVAYGIVARPEGAPIASIERLLPSGDLDTSFDRGYIVCPDGVALASRITDLEIDSDNNIYSLVECGLPLVVKLNSSNGYLNSDFGTGGFLDFNATEPNSPFLANAIALDANDNLYALGHKYPDNNLGSVTTGDNLILKFDKNGDPVNLPAGNSNVTELPKDQIYPTYAVIGPEDDNFGLLEFDLYTNSLVISGTHTLLDPELDRIDCPYDVWLTRLDLASGEIAWDATKDYWVSGLGDHATGSLVALDLTTDSNGWVSVGGYEFKGSWGSGPSFVVQARPVQAGETYSVNFNGPIWLNASDSEANCWVTSVMADSENGLYTTGECTGSSFIHHYRSDGALDSDFIGRETNVVSGISGSYSPSYIVSTDGELEIFGTGSNSQWRALTFVAKYRTTSYDDSPPDVPGPPDANGTTNGSSTETPAAPTVVPALVQPTLGVKKKISGKALATQIGMTVAPKAKVKLKVAKVSRKICKVSGGKLVALKPGNCSVTVSVTPKKTKQVKKPKTTKQSTVVKIS